MVKSICLDDRDVLWIATLDGLYSYHTISGQMQRHPLRETPLHNLDEVAYSVIADGERRWIGTKAGLIRREADGSLTHYRNRKGDSQSLVFDDINVIIRDRAGAIWAGTEAGLACLPPGSGRFVNYPLAYDSIYNKDAIIALYEDDRGQIWIGTRNGLKVLDKQRRVFHTIDSTYGMPSNIVRAIRQDGRGDYWISQDRSITRLVLRKASGPFAKQDVEIRNYPMTSGSSANEFLAANCRTSRGTDVRRKRGVVYFSPEELISNTVPPPVVLTSFLIKNQPVEIGGKHSPLQEAITYSDHITLPHDQAYFTIGFAALNYIKPGSNQYAYTLEGLSGTPEWNYVGRQQQATYTNLGAGEYVFKVKAANNDGLWNDQYTQLRITVLPPIWKTWYAWLCYVLVAGGILYFCWKYSSKPRASATNCRCSSARARKTGNWRKGSCRFSRISPTRSKPAYAHPGAVRQAGGPGKRQFQAAQPAAAHAAQWRAPPAPHRSAARFPEAGSGAYAAAGHGTGCGAAGPRSGAVFRRLRPPARGKAYAYFPGAGDAGLAGS